MRGGNVANWRQYQNFSGTKSLVYIIANISSLGWVSGKWVTFLNGSDFCHKVCLSLIVARFLHLKRGVAGKIYKPCRSLENLCGQPFLFAYWLWSCVVTVLILLTKYWRPRDVTLLNYFLQLWGVTSACWTCSTDGQSISLAAMIRPPLFSHTPTNTTFQLLHWHEVGTFLLHGMCRWKKSNSNCNMTYMPYTSVLWVGFLS